MSEAYEPPTDLVREGSGYSRSVRLIDLNGDRLPDWIVAYRISDTEIERHAYLNQGAGQGWVAAPDYIPPVDLSDERDTYSATRMIDVNMDRLPDLLWARRVAGKLQGSVWINTGSGWEESDNPRWKSPLPLDYPVLEVDVNGDTLTDLLSLPTGGGFDPDAPPQGAFLNTGGAGWFDSAYNYTGFSGPQSLIDSTLFLDVSGDGLPDHLLSYQSSEENVLETIHLNDGTRWETPGFLSNDAFRLPIPLNTVGTRILDFNGDGAVDILKQEGSQRTVWYNQYAGADLLTGFEVECGTGQRFEYTRLNDSALQQNETWEAGTVEISSSRHVVTRRVKEVPSTEGTAEHVTTYRYIGLALDLETSQSLGFSATEEIDEITGLVKRTEYSRDPDLVGEVVREATYGPERNLLHEIINRWEVNESGPFAELGIYSTQLKQITGAKYEADTEGQRRVVLQTVTDFKFDEMGNVVNAIETYADGSQTININDYYNDQSRWILGRLYRSEIQHMPASGSDQETLINVVEFEYDPATGFLLREITEPGTMLELVVEYERDRYGNTIRKSQYGANIPSSFELTNFDGDGRFPIMKENAFAQRTWLMTDPVSFQPSISIGLNGEVAQYTYDGVGRSIHTRRSGGLETSVTYVVAPEDIFPEHATYLEIREPSGMPSSVLFYDCLGRHIRTEQNEDRGRKFVTEREFNARGLLSRQSLPHFNNTAPTWSEYQYDAQGRLTLALDTKEARFQSIERRAVSNDPSGIVSEVIDSDPKNRRILSYDARGRLVRSTIESAIGKPEQKSVDFVYDARGETIRTIVDGVVIEQNFDRRGNRLSMNSGDTGLITFVNDALGRPVLIQNAAGEITSRQYDSLGRLVSESDPDRTTTFVYDAETNGIGRLAFAQTSDGHLERYSFNAIGQLTQKTIEIFGQVYDFQYEYDHLLRRQFVQYPSGLSIQESYDFMGRLNAVTDVASGHIYWEATAFDSLNQTHRFRMGDGTLTTVERLDNRGVIDSIRTVNSTGGTLRDLKYGYDAGDDLIQIQDRALSRVENMEYDGLSRLTEWRNTHDTGGSQSLVELERWFYGEEGLVERRQRTISNGSSYQAELGYAPNSHRLTSESRNDALGVIGFEYDTKGNRLSGAEVQLQYSSFNQPTRIETDDGRLETLDYGIANRLLRHTVSADEETSETYIPGGGLEHIHIETAGEVRSVWRHHIRGRDGVVAIVDWQDGDPITSLRARYLHRDALGSVTEIYGRNGQLLQRSRFSPYGRKTIINHEQSDLNRDYAGHRSIVGGDLVHMVVQAPSNPLSYDRYSYAYHRPYSFTDPSGYFFESIARSFNLGYENMLFSVGYYAAYSYTGQRYDSLKTASKEHFKHSGNHFVNFARPVVSIGAGVGITVATAGIGSGVGGAIAAGALGGALTAGVNSAIYGGNLSEVLDSSLRGGAQGAAFSYVGATMAPGGGKIIAHGIIGGAFNEINDTGSFENGFITAAATKALSPVYDFVPGTSAPAVLARVGMAYVVGGAVSELTGGSFKNGGMTAAYSRMFNTELTERLNQVWKNGDILIDRALDSEYEAKGSSRGARLWDRTKLLGVGAGAKAWYVVGSAGSAVANAADYAVSAWNSVKNYTWPSNPFQAYDVHSQLTDATFERVDEEIMDDYKD